MSKKSIEDFWKENKDALFVLTTPNGLYHYNNSNQGPTSSWKSDGIKERFVIIKNIQQYGIADASYNLSNHSVSLEQTRLVTLFVTLPQPGLLKARLHYSCIECIDENEVFSDHPFWRKLFLRW